MKYFLNITLLLLALSSCRAQNPVVAIDARYKNTPLGGYFKDLNNEFNKFEGTWTYSNGNTSLTITLQKKEMIYDGSEYYEDLLVGEYQYIESNVTVVNTLPQIIQNPDDIDNRNILGRHIIPNNLYVACGDCLPNERRIKLYFKDPERSYLSASIILRYLSDGDPFGQGAQMTATIISNGGGIIPDENSPTVLRVPYGEYLMVKQ